jgi:hypothetical protein
MHEPSEFEYLQFAQGGAHPSLLVLGAVEITKPEMLHVSNNGQWQGGNRSGR